ncbi:UNVERIFIED_CONTAM: hypothetical protein FKN15_072044 [Acipenser sinensis]
MQRKQRPRDIAFVPDTLHNRSLASTRTGQCCLDSFGGVSHTMWTIVKRQDSTWYGHSARPILQKCLPEISEVGKASKGL